MSHRSLAPPRTLFCTLWAVEDENVAGGAGVEAEYIPSRPGEFIHIFDLV
jgi:hypothetical protein